MVGLLRFSGDLVFQLSKVVGQQLWHDLVTVKIGEKSGSQ